MTTDRIRERVEQGIASALGQLFFHRLDCAPDLVLLGAVKEQLAAASGQRFKDDFFPMVMEKPQCSLEIRGKEGIGRADSLCRPRSACFERVSGPGDGLPRREGKFQEMSETAGKEQRLAIETGHAGYTHFA